MFPKILPWTSKTAPTSPLNGARTPDIEDKNSIKIISRMASARLSIGSINETISTDPGEEIKHIVGDLQHKLKIRASQLTTLSHEKDLLTKENEEIKKENDQLKLEIAQLKVTTLSLQQKIHELQITLPESSGKEKDLVEISPTTEANESTTIMLTNDDAKADQKGNTDV